MLESWLAPARHVKSSSQTALYAIKFEIKISLPGDDMVYSFFYTKLDLLLAKWKLCACTNCYTMRLKNLYFGFLVLPTEKVETTTLPKLRKKEVALPSHNFPTKLSFNIITIKIYFCIKFNPNILKGPIFVRLHFNIPLSNFEAPADE